MSFPLVATAGVRPFLQYSVFLGPRLCWGFNEERGSSISSLIGLVRFSSVSTGAGIGGGVAIVNGKGSFVSHTRFGFEGAID